MRTSRALAFSLITLTAAAALPASAQAPTFQVRSLTTETALVAAKAAMAACREQGFQVAVAVVDRAGLTQVFLRDRFAGAHSIDVASAKAWTAASFRQATAVLAEETQAGRPMSGLRATPRMMAVAGGLPIEGGGSFFGAIGVSGAPGGDADEACAQAGVEAIADAIEF